MTDIQLTETQQATISALMHDEGVIPPPLARARAAYLRNDTVVGKAMPGVVADVVDGPIAQPSEIEVRDSLPKTRSGKIVRRYLRAVELGEDPGDLSTLAD
jgi:hypothetical protein